MTVDLGASAVLDVGGIAVIVTTHCGPANDPAFFAAHGIDLAATRLLCVKARNPFRAAFAERCAAIIDVDCRGWRGWMSDRDGKMSCRGSQIAVVISRGDHRTLIMP